MNPKLQPILNTLRTRLETLYGARLVHVLVFGSQARNEAAPESDIDVLVVLKSPMRSEKEITLVGPITAALSLEHDVVISCTFLSEERFTNEQSPLLLNVRREGIPV